jgi:transmembrane sensor
MTPSRFEYLFELYKENQLSQKDWEELRRAIAEGQHEDWMKDDFWQLLRHDGLHETWTPDVQDVMWNEILNRRMPAEELPAKKIEQERSPFIGRRMIRYSVAAAILLAVLGGWLLFFRPVSRNRTPLASKHKTHNDNVRPGRDRALLTLPDGTRIDLDSAGNGRIATQRSAVFSKSNGAISISFAGSGPIPHHTGNQPEPPGNAFISTPRGGQYQLILPDGSKVWLNSSSSLRFPTVFTGKQRCVELSGEGYFEIAKNAAMPFSVKVNELQIRVLGTHFNTMAYPDEKTINTTLLEGVVEVSSGDLSKQLTPGQQAAFNNAGHQLAVGQGDIQKAVAWKNGLFEFDHTDLATIMRQLARWYDMEVIYQAVPDKTPLGGSISKNLGLTEVLDLLAANGINHFKIEGKKVFVLP